MTEKPNALDENFEWVIDPGQQVLKDSQVIKASDKQVGGRHYKEMAIQPGHFIRANNLGWYEGNAVKYICRHKAKNGRQDIEKAIHYLELVLEEYDNDNI